MMNTAEKSIYEYAKWVEFRVAEGWSPFIATFMFNPISGSGANRTATMKRDVERLYSKIVTRVERKPRSKSGVDRLPIWISCPDFPVPKRFKSAISFDVLVNDGLHMHAIVLMPSVSRLRCGLKSYFDQHPSTFCGAHTSLRRIHIVPISHSIRRVVEYALKALKKAEITYDDLLLLPRARSELQDLGPRGSSD